MEYALCKSPADAEVFFDAVASSQQADHSAARAALGFRDSSDVVDAFFAQLEFLAAEAGVTILK